jgi:hypothetical protein
MILNIKSPPIDCKILAILERRQSSADVRYLGIGIRAPWDTYLGAWVLVVSMGVLSQYERVGFLHELRGRLRVIERVGREEDSFNAEERWCIQYLNCDERLSAGERAYCQVDTREVEKNHSSKAVRLLTVR